MEEQAAEAYKTPPLGKDVRGHREACDGLTNYVCECNRAFNAETLHPLVSLIDMSSPCDGSRMKTDCYAVVFKHNAKDAEKYGRRPYDFTDGTLLFVTPRKAIDLETNDGQMLIFHPSLIKCTPLGVRLKEYSFFKYRQDESLHISCCEEKVVRRCLGCIQDELCWGVDEYSKDIISNIIEEFNSFFNLVASKVLSSSNRTTELLFKRFYQYVFRTIHVFNVLDTYNMYFVLISFFDVKCSTDFNNMFFKVRWVLNKIYISISSYISSDQVVLKLIS